MEIVLRSLIKLVCKAAAVPVKQFLSVLCHFDDLSFRHFTFEPLIQEGARELE